MTKQDIRKKYKRGDHVKAAKVLEEWGLIYSRQALQAWHSGKNQTSPAEKLFIKAYEQVIGQRSNTVAREVR